MGSDREAFRGTVVAVQGRFHAFDLARELDLRGRLARLFTSYPAGIVPRFGLDEALVRSLPWVEVSSRALRKVAPQRAKRMAPWFGARFDAWVANELVEGPDSFVGWSGQCLASLRRAKQLGMTTIVERGSAHIETQRDLLVEAGERAGTPIALPEPATIERELAEYAEADFVQVPSSFARDSFLARGFDPARILINPYGVDVHAFSPATTEPEGFRILFCGRASVQKGLPTLIDAFRAFDAPDAELWIQGSVEPDARYLVDATSDDARVRWLAHRPQHELPQVYRSAHAFCLPSVQEGLPLTLFQALASGLPAIITPNTGGEDLVTDGREGLVVGVHDADALTSAFERLHTDASARRAMGKRARTRVAAGWSWSDYGRRAVASLDDAVARTAAGPRPNPTAPTVDLGRAA